jgi:phosphoglycolate phosphatase
MLLTTLDPFHIEIALTMARRYSFGMTQTLLIVFDLDGTLVDTAPDLMGALNATLAQEGCAPQPLEAARSLLGAGARALIERGLAASKRQVSPERMEELFQFFLTHYQAHIADASRPYPGVVNALDRLACSGHRLAVCTNKLEGLSIQLLDALGLTQHFVAICGQDTFREADGRNIPKPDARALLKCIEKAGGTPERTVMVGDSRTDIDAARNADVPVIAVDFGYTDHPIRTFAPDRVISHFDALFATIGSLIAQAARPGAS